VLLQSREEVVGPRIAATADGYLVAWLERRSAGGAVAVGQGRCVARALAPDGSPRSPDVEVATLSWPPAPDALSLAEVGDSLVAAVWGVASGPDRGVLARFLSASGDHRSPRIRSKVVDAERIESLVVAGAPDGTAVVGWRDGSADGDLHLRRLDPSTAEPIDRIVPAELSLGRSPFALACAPGGSILVVVEPARSRGKDTVAVWLGADGAVRPASLGPRGEPSEDAILATAEAVGEPPSVAIGPSGALVAWTEASFGRGWDVIVALAEEPRAVE
jgi:hypothetical protein